MCESSQIVAEHDDIPGFESQLRRVRGLTRTHRELNRMSFRPLTRAEVLASTHNSTVLINNCNDGPAGAWLSALWP